MEQLFDPRSRGSLSLMFPDLLSISFATRPIFYPCSISCIIGVVNKNKYSFSQYILSKYTVAIVKQTSPAIICTTNKYTLSSSCFPLVAFTYCNSMHFSIMHHVLRFVVAPLKQNAKLLESILPDGDSQVEAATLSLSST